MQRSSGILLPISSLPSPYGIGTFGKKAYTFIDFLKKAGQSYWQILPLTTTGFGNSPYQSFSAFAGNPYFIDLDLLIKENLLLAKEVQSINLGDDPTKVDYGQIYQERNAVLLKAAERGLRRKEIAFTEFKVANSYWLDDFSAFMFLKQQYNMSSWLNWPDEALRNHNLKYIERVIQENDREINLICYIQFLFFEQWKKVRAYAKENGITILGDIPLYVSLDSADVWSKPEYFQLDKNHVPLEISGVPPDYFTADGQLWSNPLYDWNSLAKDHYNWWINRIHFSHQIYDALRIDHFRGLESYWAVPYGEETAKNGHWVKGPGMNLISVLKENFPDFMFVAEDLGYQTAAVQQLLEDSGFPGMNVLQLAFDFRDQGNPLPHAFKPHSVCYIGTHDNAPIMLWEKNARREDVERAVQYLGLHEEEGFNWGFIRAGMSSVSDLFIAQMQDFLGLAEGSRMNTPGVLENNWEWRVLDSQLTDELAAKIKMYTKLFDRLP